MSERIHFRAECGRQYHFYPSKTIGYWRLPGVFGNVGQELWQLPQGQWVSRTIPFPWSLAEERLSFLTPEEAADILLRAGVDPLPQALRSAAERMDLTRPPAQPPSLSEVVRLGSGEVLCKLPSGEWSWHPPRPPRPRPVAHPLSEAAALAALQAQRVTPPGSAPQETADRCDADRTSRPRVADRFMVELNKRGQHPERLEWSLRQWADHLGCSPQAVQQTDTWETFQKLQEEVRLERRQARGPE